MIILRYLVAFVKQPIFVHLINSMFGQSHMYFLVIHLIKKALNFLTFQPTKSLYPGMWYFMRTHFHLQLLPYPLPIFLLLLLCTLLMILISLLRLNLHCLAPPLNLLLSLHLGVLPDRLNHPFEQTTSFVQLFLPLLLPPHSMIYPNILATLISLQHTTHFLLPFLISLNQLLLKKPPLIHVGKRL